MDITHTKTTIAHLLGRYSHHISLIAFFLGFLWDDLLLPRVDERDTQLVIIGWLMLAGVTIFFWAWMSERDRGSKYTFMMWLPQGIQFLFGAAFSSLFILYMRSASLSGSWIFLMCFWGAAFGNEIFRSRFARLEFQIALFFFLVFSYFIYAVPLLVSSMGDFIFIISGIASLVVLSGLLLTLFYFARTMIIRSLRSTIVVSLSVYAIMNALYFLNVIPPIPLTLHSAGIYHSISKDPSGSYLALGEPKKSLFLFSTPVMHVVVGEPLYAFSAVFAPTALHTHIVHEWMHMNGQTKQWETVNTIVFPIVGGRQEGYRGYSMKTDPTEGSWRVIVKTEGGSEIGRIDFLVQNVTQPVSLENNEF